MVLGPKVVSTFEEATLKKQLWTYNVNMCYNAVPVTLIVPPLDC